jgi:lactoylglutathione lyase
MRSPNLLGAVGIGVSDLAKSVDFYSRVIGMTQTQTFKVEYMDEVVLAFEGRTAVVLMHYTDGSARNYKDNPVKLVFYVVDPQTISDRIKAEGLEIVREPAPMANMGGALLGLAKDPDGYIIELIQRPPVKASAGAAEAANA